MAPNWWRQADDDVRFDWGPAGVEALGGPLTIVVDVLRFTTAVEAALSRGAVVYPYGWRDESAAAFADSVGAVLANADSTGPSLSPVHMLELNHGNRVVLPSPNGATCVLAASEMGATVVAGCLRNAAAVATWANDRGTPVNVVASGERWPDGSLRPALEDLLGAGAILERLEGRRSPEAEAATAAFRALGHDLPGALERSASGQELLLRGFSADLEHAGALDVSTIVPVLSAGAFG
jgi:2-phosphosulfolactate phosphatase